MALHENPYYKCKQHDEKQYYADSMNLYRSGSPKKSPELK